MRFYQLLFSFFIAFSADSLLCGTFAESKQSFTDRAYKSLLERCAEGDRDCQHISRLNSASPELLRDYAEDGDAKAALFLGTAYLVGGHMRSGAGYIYELEPSTSEFLKFTSMAVKNGSSDALNRLVAYYFFGPDYFQPFDHRGVLDSADWERNEESACRAVDDAAEEIVIQAGYLPLYVGGQCYLATDRPIKGLTYLSVAAANYNHGPSAYMLAELYQDGMFGVPQSAERSAHWLSIYASILKSRDNQQ